MYNIPEDIKYILNKIRCNGFEAYIVGGAVRDLYLNRKVNDYDITTNALPDTIEEIFEKTIPTGKKFGTITVVYNYMNIEVTTFRKDISYSNRRSPDKIEFTTSLKDDLSRRDFTMNAMALDDNNKIIDLFNGIDELNNKTILCVGDAKERFDEDYLRVFRYIRFTTKLDFNRNKNIDKVIKELPFSNSLSVERIREELNKILLSNNPSKGLIHLKELNLLSILIPQIKNCYDFDQNSKFHDLDVFYHTLKVVDNTDADLILRLAALLHDIGKPNTFELIDGEGHFYGHHKESVEIAKEFLIKFKYPNKIIDDVLSLINNHMRLLDCSNKKSVKKFMNKIGIDLLEKFLNLRKADILGCKTNDDIKSIEIMKNTFDKILSSKEPLSVKDLKINGYDLINLNYKGKEIGYILNNALEFVIEHPDENNKIQLLKFIKKLNKRKNKFLSKSTLYQ